MLPRPGDRVLILEQYWLNKLADGSKTLEVREKPAAAGGTWLSAQGRIQAWARIGHAVRADAFGDFASEVGRHCIHTNDLPYERTWFWPITDLRVFAETVAHSREPGPVTWRRFAAPRPTCETGLHGASNAPPVVHNLIQEPECQDLYMCRYFFLALFCLLATGDVSTCSREAAKMS